MRLILGMILGVCLTIGVAYISDAMRSAPGADGVEGRPMVNWEVVDHNFRTLSASVQEGWARLTGRERAV